MRILKNIWFNRFARKEGITDAMLHKSIEQAEKGLTDADLGGGVIKQRIARVGAGKSGGYRTIILFRTGDRALFVYGFAKSDRENITPEETKAFRVLAVDFLSMSNAQIDSLIEQEGWKEIVYHATDLS